MRVLIRFLTRTPAGAVEQRDKTFDGDALTIGRATDQVLHLKDRRVALQHARIARRGAHFVLSCIGVAGATVNGSPVRESRLEAGDAVQIGANILRLFDAPKDFDLAFTFELDPAAATEALVRERPVTRLSETGWHKRRWAWILFIGVLLLTLLVPAASLRAPALRDTLRTSPLPSDRAWTAGPLHPVHSVIAGKCEACHREPFVAVRNEECLTCHRLNATAHILEPELLVVNAEQQRCTSCHMEHKEPSVLVRRDDAVCSDCHRGLEQQLGEDATVRNVSDFARDHPAFKVSVLQTDSNGNTRVQRRALADPALRESSQLRFSHAVHLDTAGIESPQGQQVLNCGDCHHPEPGGARMQPIAMERDCATCHRLNFDPANPEREVPHGSADRVLQSLIEYYSSLYLRGSPDPLATATATRSPLRPLPELTPAEREAVLQRARDQASRVARDLFERRTCDTCHEVQRLPENRGWTVTPVRLTEHWLPWANFDHARHGTTLTTCNDCHAAVKSKRASDVLVPDIGVCQQCHDGGDPHAVRTNHVASGCATCHDFHLPDAGPWPASHPAGPG